MDVHKKRAFPFPLSTSGDGGRNNGNARGDPSYRKTRAKRRAGAR